MSGHNKWSTIKHKKGKADAERGKIFTKLIKEITVAARMGGGDIAGNARLRKAVLEGRANNMPAENIKRAIMKGTGELEGVVYEEYTYEGYGPNGAAVLVDAMTDNKNRTTGEVRLAFNKCGGKMAVVGSVAYLFRTAGHITVDKAKVNEDELMLVALDAGAVDVEAEDDQWIIETGFEDLWEVREKLEAAGIAIADTKTVKLPSLTVELGGKDADTMLKLMDMLEDNDDVQHVWSNFDLDDATVQRLNQ
ncbi:MAG: YebC/PmpR family DNA-binding transcriptional regulator [Myxococcota bacterium]|jgi:YebC/PmpR family DNA-binding regulatory protein